MQESRLVYFESPENTANTADADRKKENMDKPDPDHPVNSEVEITENDTKQGGKQLEGKRKEATNREKSIDESKVEGRNEYADQLVRERLKLAEEETSTAKTEVNRAQEGSKEAIKIAQQDQKKSPQEIIKAREIVSERQNENRK
jgi:hypothetical protein